ncbi:MAG: hypothetical protein EWV55_09380 [Microcystis viridis Mv_BB_P_19951000_S69]|uniref:Uncharacterized protein n=1 Tax=Microcystis viridis Mv_BB_P_19951000_S68D TaxID=2486270 RepID=A0A552HA05_MICVR|nr:MAG: hypothetical protein EWV77_20920 [Microcystis viridis Mv_BB_P_19951000_S68D]TRU75209.1 MAG: hypothetical protein EWV55_09380 [Microcystis viridis Mv_BB_P_19951000_S69]TRU78540.1 MAG: hypothetical protein EWV47_01605 [Microcystis viridis Mv_BB_P_19951000_S68]TRU89346.1 MAG: hypothetical protein EWV46_03935 [Microcystis viridis Mv_BB_P_19951000_S69D]
MPLHQRSHPVGAKHSDRKSTVSAIGYCPNASPVLFQQTLISLTLIFLPSFRTDKESSFFLLVGELDIIFL